MNNTGYVLAAVAVMAIVTYLPRMLPLTLVRKRITNRFLQSFLYYVPYAVLAAMMQVSRTQAVQCIRSGAVAINHMPMQSAHADVFENDVFSVRGYGKYKLCTVGGKSRKGRRRSFQYLPHLPAPYMQRMLSDLR